MRAGRRRWDSAVLVSTVWLAVLSGCQPTPDDGKVCIVWTEAIRPLTLGDTTRVRAGRIDVSDCIPDESVQVVWSTPDPRRVRVTADGLVRGQAPGMFDLTATTGSGTLRESGFVLPAGWDLRIDPDSAVVRVGDSVSYRVVALDAEGQELPAVPFSLYTPEFGRPGSRELPLVDRYSYQGVMTLSAFEAVRPGQTVITGKIGNRRVSSPLTVVE